MIKAVFPGDDYPAAGQDPFSAMLFSAHAVYGQDGGPPRFWRDRLTGGVCALSGDALVVSGHFDPEELSSLWIITGAAQLRGRKADLASFADFRQTPPSARPIMCLPEGEALPALPPAGKIVYPSPAKIFPLLQSVFGLPDSRFPAWYCEVSHKIRHGLGKVAAVEEADRVVSTAGIYHQNPSAALISSVATLPDCRSRGLAAHLCRTLAQEAALSGRVPFVICQTPAVVSLYRKIGFVLWDEEWTFSRQDR